MRILLPILLPLLMIFITPFLAYADRVCLDKNGKLIEYQSGDAPLGALKQNAVNAGYKADEVTEKYVTRDEWLNIKKEQLDDPIKQKKDEEKIAKDQKASKLKQKLNLTDKDWEDLKDALQ